LICASRDARDTGARRWALGAGKEKDKRIK
jgi:hypothetical protein